ncbi:hypothetical protein IEQ34_004756 [Dendrobium chrysotoxum]|uniref:RAWUL domain-containing protein n=1 Tax=Dendrobium chrysotoxum TaxID=161865 RepID=A0AAV7HHK1_DENCH|nr:hypothetical protein IEQ34_004756 [Dendrobium chrysotoxum]
MVPARNLLRRHYDCYGGYFSDSYFDFEKPPPALRSPEFMGGLANCEERQEEEEEEEEEAGTSNRDAGDQCCEGWLQLGVGVGIRPPTSRRSPGSSSSAPPLREVRVALSTELELFAPRPAAPEPMNIPMFPPPPPPHLGVFYPRDAPWGFWNAGSVAMGVGPPAFLPPVRSFVVPFESSSVAASGELRLVSTPARPQAGVWFMLKASQSQVREPFLPQIPKSYLRIKDGRMTVRLLKKYLVNKLGLEDESEVEISCRGQPLLPFLTLQHIRDNIWQVREASTSLTLLPVSPCDEHLMTLQYGRST